MMPDGSWIRIEQGSLKNILDLFRPEILHPDDPRYIEVWRNLKAKYTNGLWVPQFNGVRFVPGRLGFFGVLGRFYDWSDKKERIVTTPKIRDLEWHRAYYRTEMDGFSGFSNDPDYTSDLAIYNASKYDKKNLSEERWLHLFKKNGNFKEYIPARENLFMIHEDRAENLGHPLFNNPAKNHAELGSRGSGKSYFTALGEVLPDICLDGAKYFDPDNPKVTTRAEIEVTCGGNDKSSEMLDKVEFGMNCLANPDFPELGVWKYNEEEIEPCPLWKQMTGSLATNNKGNPWINEISVKVGNRWIKRGNRDVVYNTQYAANSKAAAQKSAGGRRTYVVHEEFGLNTEIESAWGSNEGMVTDSGIKQAGQKGIGTSGNMETIVGAKKIMTNPRAFSCLPFKYGESETCFFLPVYIGDQEFKDKDGNTDVEGAKLKALKIREEKANSNEASVYLEHIMNYPIYIEDMWVQGQGNLLPALEAEAREKELMQDGLYKELGTPIELFWDNMQPRGINYRIDKDAVPFYEYPFEPNRTTKRTVFMMYIHPSKLEVHGHIPNDAVIAVHDPYVSDEMDKGGSLGATYFVVNPKYIKDGLPGNCIAASLLGKAPNGVDDYNRMLHLGLYFYGDPIGCLWYEANRGDKLRSYFLRQKKLNSLCLRPQFEQGQYLYLRNVAQTGYMVSGQSRIFLLDAFSDWLLQDTELTINGQTETKKNIQRIPCMFLLKQIKLYNQKENFDAVDAMQGLPLALGEQRHRIEAKTQSNSFSVISNYLKERKYARR